MTNKLKIDNSELPDNWIYFDRFVERSRCDAAYRTEEHTHFVEVHRYNEEYQDGEDTRFKITLLEAIKDKPETIEIQKEDAYGAEEVKNICMDLIEQCN